MSTVHDHDHHHHAAGSLGMAFFLNFGFALVEIAGGFLTGSTAILADAVHDLGDSLALGQAWYFERLSTAGPDARYSYGYRRFSLLGAFFSSVLLIATSLAVLVHAVPRLFEPTLPHAEGMAAMAVLGFGVNLLALLSVRRGEGMNARVAALHLLEDVLGWVAVLVVALVLLFVDLPVLDPLLAVIITGFILSGVLKNLRRMAPIFLQGVPDAVDLPRIVSRLESVDGVRAVHDAHVWSLDGRHGIFSAHVEADRGLDASGYRELKGRLGTVLRGYGFQQSTLEIEFPGETCRDLSGTSPPQGG